MRLAKLHERAPLWKQLTQCVVKATVGVGKIAIARAQAHVSINSRELLGAGVAGCLASAPPPRALGIGPTGYLTKQLKRVGEPAARQVEQAAQQAVNPFTGSAASTPLPSPADATLGPATAITGRLALEFIMSDPQQTWFTAAATREASGE